MPIHYARRFKFSAPPGIEPIVALGNGLRRWLGERWPSDRSWFGSSEPATVSAGNGELLRWEPFLDFQRALVDFTWRSLDEASGTTWVTSMTWLADSGQSELYFRIATDRDIPEGALARRATWVEAIPALASAARLGAVGAGSSSVPRIVGRPEVADLVRYDLWDPARQEPILLITPRQDGSYALSPEHAARRLVSLARVVVIDRPEATFLLTDMLERRELSAFLGAARLYLPGFAREARPEWHPLLLAGRLSRPETLDQLTEQLARATVAGFRSDLAMPELRKARSAAWDLRRRAVLGQLAAGTLPEQQEWRRLAEENIALEARAEDLERQVTALERELAKLRHTVVDPAGESDAAFAPRSVLEAVENTAGMYGGSITFLPSAFESAAQSPYRRTSELARVLGVLADVSGRLREGPLGRSLLEEFRERGVEYKSGISRSSSQRIRNQFRFRHQGVEYACEEHLSLGGATYDPEECLRIYFKSGTGIGVVVGHVGRHLDTMRTS